MRRRQFLPRVGGAIAVGPCRTLAQRSIGPEFYSRLSAHRHKRWRTGNAEGRNLMIEVRGARGAAERLLAPLLDRQNCPIVYLRASAVELLGIFRIRF
jgi:hypothetical protein